MTISLYQLSTDYKTALNDLLFCEEAHEAEVLNQKLLALQGDIETKSINIAAFFLNLEAEAMLVKEAAKKMRERAKSLKSKVDKLKDYLMFHMEQYGITEIKCPEFLIKLADCPWSLNVIDETAIPPEFFAERTIRELNKAMLKEHMKQTGECIDGATLERKKRLIIK